MKAIKRGWALAAALLLPLTCARGAEQFSGTVVAAQTVAVTAPFGGTVHTVAVRPGQTVAVGDGVATLATAKVWATEDGVVRGLSAQAGDSAQQTVMYLSPVSKYTIQATIDKAYASVATKYVRIGETVYLRCTADGSHKALGVVTAVSGSQYTVQTTGGELYLEETVYLYRQADYATASRIGSGTVARTDAIAVSGSGSILKLHVADGETVERGQLLFETVEGTLDGLTAVDETIRADAAGVVAEVKAQTGQKLAQGDVVMTLYPESAYQVRMTVPQEQLGLVSPGTQVKVYFYWNPDSPQVYPGQVLSVSFMGESGDEAQDEAAYEAYVAIEADEGVRLGMSVTVLLNEQEVP